MVRTALIRRLSFLALLLFAAAAAAAPKAELWPRWQAHQPGSIERMDHGAWDRLLQKHVQASADGINRVAYARIGTADRQELAGYLARLQAAPVSKLRRAEQRACWINLYNAATVKVVLDHAPVDSILKINISPGLFSRGPWGKKLLAVEGEAVSLDDIEHRILRPIWKDPRTHYALNCASLGCPNLAARAWSVENMDGMLDAGARAYVNHPRGARVNAQKLYVSTIYRWFKADFGGTDAGVIAHLRAYAEPALAKQLAGIEEIEGDGYDWALNAVR